MRMQRVAWTAAALLVAALGAAGIRHAITATLGESLTRAATRLADTTDWSSDYYAWSSNDTIVCFPRKAPEFGNPPGVQFLAGRRIDVRNGEQTPFRLSVPPMAGDVDYVPAPGLNMAPSPDGKTIAWADQHSDGTVVLAVTTATGALVRQWRTQAPADSLPGRRTDYSLIPGILWSPDSHRFLYRTGASSGVESGTSPDAENQSVYWVPGTTARYGSARDLMPSSFGLQSNGGLRWAQQNSFMGSRTALAVVRMQSPGMTALTGRAYPIRLNTQATIVESAFSPAANRLAWVLQSGEQYEPNEGDPPMPRVRGALWLSDIDGANAIKLGDVWPNPHRLPAEGKRLPCASDQTGVHSPRFSPDGKRLAFILHDTLYVIGVPAR